MRHDETWKLETEPRQETEWFSHDYFLYATLSGVFLYNTHSALSKIIYGCLLWFFSV